MDDFVAFRDSLVAFMEQSNWSQCQLCFAAGLRRSSLLSLLMTAERDQLEHEQSARWLSTIVRELNGGIESAAEPKAELRRLFEPLLRAEGRVAPPVLPESVVDDFCARENITGVATMCTMTDFNDFKIVIHAKQGEDVRAKQELLRGAFPDKAVIVLEEL